MIQIHDSLTRQKKPFVPLVPGQVRMYVCGPTVYSDCHIGHTMGPVLFDAVARWLAVRGHRVRFVNNITDIEDKIIARSIETGEPWQDITARYTEQYNFLLRELNVTTITDQPRCTDYVPQMVAFIGDLIAKGRAYVASDGVYFEVRKQPSYGKLSGRKLDEMRSEEGDTAGLRDPADFALWKLAKPGEPSWPSPWGAGRPGWHIECSAMSSDLLGGAFDIHGGGEELKFPHHENEIAQSEAHGDCFACTWMHNGLVQYEGKKVSKSDPRMRDPAFAQQFQALHLIEQYGGEALRFHILRGHYRRPQEFKPADLAATRTTLERLRTQLREGLGATAAPAADLAAIDAIALPEAAAQHRTQFCAMMDDDFNTGAAIAQLFPLAALARKATDAGETKRILGVVHGLAHLLGMFAGGLAAPASTGEISSAGTADHHLLDQVLAILVRQRQDARARRDFAAGDRIRDELAALGITLVDGRDGTTWTRTG